MGWRDAPLTVPAPPPETAGSWRDAPLAAPAPAEAAADPEQGLLDAILGGAGEVLDTSGYLAQELARGVTQLVGSPVDLVNASPMLLNILPGEQGMTPMSDDPFLGSEHLWELLTAPRDVAQEVIGAEVGDATADGPVERVAGRVMNEIGAAALPVAAGINVAGRIGTHGARHMQQSARPIERLAGNFVESAAASPKKFAAKEITYATGAGAGAGIAREAVSDGDPNTTTSAEAGADLIGAILGTGTTALGDAGARAAGDVITMATGAGGGELVRGAVAEELARAAGPRAAPLTSAGAPDSSDLAAVLNSRAGAASRNIPGFVESTADATQNPGLASLEYGRQSGPNAGVFAQRRQSNQQAVNDAIDANQPDATPGAFRETLEIRRDDALLEAQTKQYLAQAEFDKAAERLAAAQSGEARGQAIRGALEDALAAAKEVERTAWAGVQGEVDPTGLRDAFDGVTDSLTAAQREGISGMEGFVNIPKQLAGDAADVSEEAELMAQVFGDAMTDGAGAAPVPLSEVTSLRSAFTDKARAARSAGDHQTARALDMYVEAVDAYLDQAAPDIVQEMGKARAVTRDLNDRFNRPTDPVAQSLSKNEGRYRVPDSQVAGKFVQPDERQATNVDQLLRETENAADVRAALEDQLRANAQGLLDKPERLDEFVSQHGQVFEKFPELREEFGSASALRRKLDGETTAAKATERELAQGPVGKYLQFGDERAKDAMAGVVNAKDPAAATDELLRMAGDSPEAREGAKSAFWQLMESKARSSGASTKSAGGEQAWRPNSLRNFLRDPKNRAVMERLYADNPEHMQSIEEIADTLAELDFRTSAKAPNSSGTPQALQGSNVLPSTETIASRTFAVKRGQVSPTFAALNVLSVVARRATLKGRGKEFQEVLDEALLNPEFAAQLLKEHNPANVAALNRGAKAWLGARAPALADLLEDEPGEDDELIQMIQGDQ